MSSLYVFNPENDIALATMSPYYSAPKNALAFRTCCASLPWVVAGSDDYVLVESLPPRSWLEQTEKMFGAVAKFVTSADNPSIDRIVPWGWSPALKQTLTQRGARLELLPSDRKLIDIRELTHRRTALLINKMLASAGLNVPPEAVEAVDETDIKEYIARHDRIVLKAPFSSSGRGVADSAALSREMFVRRAVGVIARQGSVMLEPWLDRQLDFAMLFEVKADRVAFVGLSRFLNCRMGSYEGNLVARQSVHRDAIEKYIGSETIGRVVDALESVLGDVLIGQYEGYCGVDMMIYRGDRGEMKLAPCIELNLRMTMGVVAACLAERLFEQDSIARLMPEPASLKSDDMELLMRSDWRSGQSPLKQTAVICNLTPPSVFTQLLSKIQD